MRYEHYTEGVLLEINEIRNQVKKLMDKSERLFYKYATPVSRKHKLIWFARKFGIYVNPKEYYSFLSIVSISEELNFTILNSLSLNKLKANSPQIVTGIEEKNKKTREKVFNYSHFKVEELKAYMTNLNLLLVINTQFAKNYNETMKNICALLFHPSFNLKYSRKPMELLYLIALNISPENVEDYMDLPEDWYDKLLTTTCSEEIQYSLDLLRINNAKGALHLPVLLL